MSTVTGIHDPLHNPERDARTWTPSLSTAIDRARRELVAHADANIHSHGQMLTAAVSLDHVLRDLLAALDQEAAR
ncbi:hypothetical protein KQY30_24855 [Streptomyces sp. GMY02]|uniref:hypothetical protein n=1 Tax=Streptomyces sp. GMY02 TaxID=1333528 RepID=UPI001C2BE14A|nr:hypothetical protein [Streptomyces sp. GMY02]QXE36957.1 hypothetical protein KQY30_24855 [Streptomyces sp. GMY02]